MKKKPSIHLEDYKIPNPEEYGLKSPCLKHYLKAQFPLIDKYKQLIEEEEGPISEDESIKRYSEERGKDRLTESERYRMEYTKRFLSGYFKITPRYKEWAEKIKEAAMDLLKHLEKKKKIQEFAFAKES